MGRPIYPHELTDSDFAWLISSYRETHPEFKILENAGLPVLLVKEEKIPTFIPMALPPTIAAPEAGSAAEEDEAI